MSYQIFLSPEMKQCAVITYEPGIYELPQELPNNLKSDFHLPKKYFYLLQ